MLGRTNDIDSGELYALALNSLDKKLLSRLLRHDVVSSDQVPLIEEQAARDRQSVSTVVTKLGFADEKITMHHLARINGLEFLDLNEFEPDPAIFETLSTDVVYRTRALPIGMVGETLVVAVADASNIYLIDELKVLAARPVQSVLVTETALNAAIAKYYPTPPSRDDQTVCLEDKTILMDATTESPTDESSPSQAETQLEPPPAPSPRAKPEEFHDRETLMDHHPISHFEENDDPSKPNRLPSDDAIATRKTRIIPLSQMATRLEQDMAESQSEAERSERFHKSGGRASDEIRPITHSDVESWAEEDQLPRDESTGGTSINKILREMIDHALENHAEELEFAPPSARRNRTRIRKDGLWVDSIPYPVKYHESLIAQIKRLSGISPRSREPVECHFSLSGKRADIPIVACFTPTLRGDRCVLRFQDNIPLIQKPLRVLGVENTNLRDFDKRLGGSGGGIFYVTSAHSRLTGQIFSSILFDQVSEGRSVTSINWTSEREIPGVHQVECADEAGMLETLRLATAEETDLVGVSSIPNAEVMQELFTAAMRGRSIVACHTALNSAMAQAALRASGIDAMKRTMGLIAHVHVSRVPRLCPQCQQPMEKKPRRLPSFVEGMDPDLFFEANGCPACGGTGRKGTSWAPEVFIPDPEGTGEFVTLRDRETSLRVLVDEGFLDIRDVK